MSQWGFRIIITIFLMKRDLVVCFVQKLDNIGSVDLKDGLGWEWGCDCHFVNMFESSSADVGS